MTRVDDHAVGDHRRDVRIEDARGDELELQQPALGDHGVARVVPALIADHVVHAIGEVVDRLALALVPPLGAEHDRGRHEGGSLPGYTPGSTPDEGAGHAMASQILNEKSFAPAAVQQATGGRETTGTMTYGGVAIRAVFFLVLTAISAGFGWQAAANERPARGCGSSWATSC